MTNAAFLYTDLEVSTYLSVCKLNTFVWMVFLIFDRRKM